MMQIAGDNIISSLGFTTEENFNAVKLSVSGVKYYKTGTLGLPEAFMASLIDKERLNEEFSKINKKNNYTNLEKAAILSVFNANKKAQIDLSSEKTIFILSTTKGNVALLDIRHEICDMRQSDIEIIKSTKLKPDIEQTHIYLWHTGELIADFFKNPNTPILVSNACISGAAAQITAMRELESERYNHAVVVGVDFLTKFIISGFQSFKALSPELCCPFDKNRCGLNLGEAAATIIFNRNVKEFEKSEEIEKVVLIAGAIRNDATHISAPSRTGEGSFRVLQSVLSKIGHRTSDIAFINAHGTATPYNDAMETQALTRAGLEHVPVNSLKAFFGHTLGAAGVLETIISAKAFAENTVLKSLNFEKQNFENNINVSKENHYSDKKYFIKTLAGFGGSNAALLFGYPTCDTRYATDNNIVENRKSKIGNQLYIKKHIKLSFQSSAEVTKYYRTLQTDYPKFFKMDGLSKLGFLAAETIFKNCENRFVPTENMAIIGFNGSSSLDTDTQYQATICDSENYFPSPSLFVYTLPNIVLGEIAIRNKIFGETSFYLCKKFDAKQIASTVRKTFLDTSTTAVLVAWIECFENRREVLMVLVDSEKNELEFSEKQLNLLYDIENKMT